MSWKATLAVAAAFLAFAVYVVVSSMGVGAARCEVCVVHNGLRNCATATAASEEEAARSAQTTACATISGGVTDGIACGNAAPVARTCSAE